MAWGITTYDVPVSSMGTYKKKVGESFDEYRAYWEEKRASWAKSDRLSAIRTWLVFIFILGGFTGWWYFDQLTNFFY